MSSRQCRLNFNPDNNVDGHASKHYSKERDTRQRNQQREDFQCLSSSLQTQLIKGRFEMSRPTSPRHTLLKTKRVVRVDVHACACKGACLCTKDADPLKVANTCPPIPLLPPLIPTHIPNVDIIVPTLPVRKLNREWLGDFCKVTELNTAELEPESQCLHKRGDSIMRTHLAEPIAFAGGRDGIKGGFPEQRGRAVRPEE